MGNLPVQNRNSFMECFKARVVKQVIAKWNKLRERPGEAVAHIHNQVTVGLFK